MSDKAVKLTPVEIIRAIEELTPEEVETLMILLDRELSGELLVRREEAKEEMKGGKLRTKREVFGEADD